MSDLRFELLEELLAAWEPHRQLAEPPPQHIRLWYDQTRTVYIHESWGPVVPYPAVTHHDGARNHGYMRLKGDPEAVGQVPEAQGWPEFQSFLRAINEADTPIESVGCEKGFFHAQDAGDAAVQIGSYVDVVFSHSPLNEEPENHLRLAAALAAALEGSERWSSATEIGLQRFCALHGCARPWGLMVRVSGYGRNEEEARRAWAVSLERLGNTIVTLPLEFPSER